MPDGNSVFAESFPRLFEAESVGEAELAVMAIENSIAGPILANYDLLTKYEFEVLGEGVLRIKHCLIGFPGKTVDDVKTAYSHEMAIKQCREFLDEHGIVGKEYEDTAAAVDFIKRENLQDAAGIAPAIAAQIHGMEVLAEGIESDHENFTRFLVIGPELIDLPELQRGADLNKAMFSVRLRHEPGSLANFLELLSEENFNLTYIQSRPIKGEPWSYQFYIDFASEREREELREKLAKLGKQAEALRVFGVFEMGGVY